MYIIALNCKSNHICDESKSPYVCQMKKLQQYILSLRKDFTLHMLDEKTVSKNPFSQFEKWMTDAIEAETAEVNAMTLSTCNRKNEPASRIVLLRNIDKNGLSFFT